MDFEVFLTSRAQRDLFAIWRFIARTDPEAAPRFCTDLNSKAWSLSSFPESAPQIPHRRNVRRVLYKNYLIYYRADEDTRTIEILRFRHGARDEGKMRLKEAAVPY